MTPAQIKALLDQHEQRRQYSCFQSAVEMVLKLKNVLNIDEYPEQVVVQNDQNGFIPFSGQTRIYGTFSVTFREKKYEPFATKALDHGRELLNAGIYPIYSFMRPDLAGYHGYVGFLNEAGELEFITKDYLLASPAVRYTSAQLLPHQTKTEVLIVKLKKIRAAQP